MITKLDQSVMNLLWHQMMDAEFDFRYRLCSALYFNKRNIVFGINQKKSHPLQGKYCKNPHAVMLHAEIDAIRKALRIFNADELKDSILYVARLKYSDPDNKEPMWGMAKPCKGCMMAIESFDIPRVVYSTDLQEFEVLTRR